MNPSDRRCLTALEKAPSSARARTEVAKSAFCARSTLAACVDAVSSSRGRFCGFRCCRRRAARRDAQGLLAPPSRHSATRSRTKLARQPARPLPALGGAARMHLGKARRSRRDSHVGAATNPERCSASRAAHWALTGAGMWRRVGADRSSTSWIVGLMGGSGWSMGEPACRTGRHSSARLKKYPPPTRGGSGDGQPCLVHDLPARASAQHGRHTQ